MPPRTGARKRVRPIHLDWNDGTDRQVVVTPSDHDRFCLTVQKAVEACRASQRSIEFSSQFTLLLGKLAGWIRDNADSVEKAFLTIRENGLLFVVIQSGTAYDRSLESSLTQLELGVWDSEELNLIKDIEVLALPRSDEPRYQAFLNAEFTLAYDAD